MTARVQLGDKVADRVTCFTGIAIARTVWLTGEPSVGVQPIAKNHETLRETEWFDEARLEVIVPDAVAPPTTRR